jgi:Phosphopantetheine attachment site/AMP-binding enzyme C-terminal domain
VRIEPTEIEEAARSLPGMLDCALDGETFDDGSTALALYAVLTPGLTADSLRAHLQDRLPGPYMPSAVRACHEIPRLLSGKVDFAALRTAEKRSRQPSEPPSTPMEMFMLELFRRLVRDETVGKEDNFFDVGGHSLLAIQALSRIREEQQVEVPLAAFFENATARALAAFVARCPVLSTSAETKPAEEKRIDLAALSDQDLDRLLADLTRQG